MQAHVPASLSLVWGKLLFHHAGTFSGQGTIALLSPLLPYQAHTQLTQRERWEPFWKHFSLHLIAGPQRGGNTKQIRGVGWEMESEERRESAGDIKVFLLYLNWVILCEKIHTTQRLTPSTLPLAHTANNAPTYPWIYVSRVNSCEQEDTGGFVWGVTEKCTCVLMWNAFTCEAEMFVCVWERAELEIKQSEHERLSFVMEWQTDTNPTSSAAGTDLPALLQGTHTNTHRGWELICRLFSASFIMSFTEMQIWLIFITLQKC